jgi:hypothetical protein
MDNVLYRKGFSIKRFGICDGLFKAGQLFIWTKNSQFLRIKSKKNLEGNIMNKTRLVILLLILGVIFVFASCGGGNVDKACENMWEFMMGDIAGDEGKDEYMKECKKELSGESAEIINCIANAESVADLEDCE